MMTQRKMHGLWFEMKPFLFSTVGTVVLLNGCVAALAFFKDVLLATYFGTSLQADALTLAYFLPDTIGNSLIAAALGVSCVPVFVRLYALGERKRLAQHIRSSLLIFSLFALAVMFGLYAFNENISGWLAGSATSDLGHLTVMLIRTMLPIVIILPAFAIGSSLLQSTGTFTASAAAPLLSHVLIILVLICGIGFRLNREQTVHWVSWAITLGVVIMTAMVWAAVIRKKPLERMANISEDKIGVGLAPSGNAGRWWEDQWKIWSVFLPYLFILISSQAVYFVERQLASGMEIGTVAGVNYAFRISQFPVWVFVSAVYSIVLPSMSKDLALQRREELQLTIENVFKKIFMVTLPTTLIFYFLRIPIISTLFQRGAFDAVSVQITSDVLKGYALSIIGLSLSAVCLRYFLAAGKMLLPLVVTVVSTSVTIIADYLLKDSYGAGGLGYGAAIGATVNAAIFLLLVSITLRFSFRKALRPFIYIVLANAVPCIVLFLLSNAWNNIPHYGNGTIRIFILGCTVGLCAAIYYAALRKFRIIKHS